MMKQALKSVCLGYSVPIQGLLEAEEQSCDDIFERVQAGIGAPPYFSRRNMELSNLDYPRISLQNMRDSVELLLAVMDFRSSGLLFWFAQKFKRWYEQVVGEVEKVVKEKCGWRWGGSELEKMFSKWKQTCCIMWKPWDLSRDPRVNHLKPMSFSEYGIHFWWKRLPADEMLGRIDCMGVQNVARAHPAFKNVLISVTRIYVDKDVYWNHLTENVWRRMLRPYQKSVSLMKSLVQMFLKSDNLMLDAFQETFSTAKMCLLLEKKRRFLGCVKNSGFVKKSMTGLVNV